MMSKGALIIGLVISVAIHVVLLWPMKHQPVQTEMATARSVSVVELPMVATLPEQEEPAPEIEPEPIDEPEPITEPEPVPEPLPEPEPAVIEPPTRMAAESHEEPPAELPETAPQPLEPIVSAPPAPIVTPLESVAEGPRTTVDGPGDFTGQTDGPFVPALWIDWGTPQEAMNVLLSGGMQLVVLEKDESIRHAVSLTSQGPKLAVWRPDRQAPFSNRIRIVDHVNAFSGIARSLSLPPGTHLAVLFPMRVDQLVDTAQRRAAFDEGAAMDQIRGFAGHFMITAANGASRSGSGVSFIVTHLQRR